MTMDDELWDLMTDRDKLNAYECACQDLAKANARLAEAERDRDEERAAFDQAHKDALKWIDKAIEVKLAHDDLWEQVKRQRRTIRALVVAARALRQAGWNWRWRGLTTDFMVIDVRARVAQIRLQEKLNSEQAREANNG